MNERRIEMRNQEININGKELRNEEKSNTKLANRSFGYIKKQQKLIRK